MTLKPTDEMIEAACLAADEDGLHLWRDTATAIVEAVLTAAETQIRAAVAAEIQAALADDQADDDTTSGEAIWEQTGYRRGLADAARLAAQQTEETH